MAAQTPVRLCVCHPGMGFEYVCIGCNEEPVCKRCVVDKHSGHKFVLIEDFVFDKKNKLQQYVDRVSNTDNPDVQKHIKETEDKMEENRNSFKQMISDIRYQANKMKSEIDHFADKLVELCCELEKSNHDLLKSYKSALENLKDHNTRRIKDCQRTLESGTNMEVIEKAKDTDNKQDCPLVPKMKAVQFHSGPILSSQLEHLLGFVIVDGRNQNYCPMMKPTVLSEFTHTSHVTTCCVTQDSTWLSCWEDQDMYRVDHTGNVEEKIQCEFKVSNITVSPTTGRLWFCCREDKTVREVMDNDTILTRFVTDSRPGSLCITGNNGVVVGMDGKIQMYTTDGQEVKGARGAGGPYRQEAVSPHHMAYSTQTGDVAVSDADGVSCKNYMAGKKPGKQPHIKVMDKHLNVRFKYSHLNTSDVLAADDRNPGDTGRSSFYPNDLCFDLSGNILVTEFVTKSIILIDGVGGDYLQTIHMDNIQPLSISLQTDSTLWVGLNGKKVKILK